MPGDVGLRELKRRQTRETLIEAAVGLFDRYGYEAVTVAQIAAAAGVSRKTFFNYFPGKEDVVFGNPQRRLDAALRVIADRAAGPPARLAASVRRAAGIVTVALQPPHPETKPCCGPGGWSWLAL